MYFLPRIASHIIRKQNLAGVQNLTEQQVNDQINPKAIEFLEFLLEFDPEKRPTAQQALQHPYLAEYYYAEEDDLEIEQVIDTKDFEGYQTGQEQIEVSGCKNRAWELLTTYREEFIEKACHEYSSVITIEWSQISPLKFKRLKMALDQLIHAVNSRWFNIFLLTVPLLSIFLVIDLKYCNFSRF